MIKAALFDIDGTLLDTKEFVYQAYLHTLEKHGIKNVEREYVESLGGRTLEEYYSILAPDIEFELLRESHRIFQSENMHLSSSFQGAGELLKGLKKRGCKIAAITSRARSIVIKTLEAEKIYQYFDLIIAIEDVVKAKPDPEGILEALKYFKIKSSEALMVGDNEVDIEAGKAAGVQTVGVSFGFAGKKISKFRPDFVIDQLSGLPEILANS